MSNLLTFATPTATNDRRGDQDGKSHPSGLPVRTYNEDFSAMRGFVNALVISAAMWLGIIGTILWLRS